MLRHDQILRKALIGEAYSVPVPPELQAGITDFSDGIFEMRFTAPVPPSLAALQWIADMFLAQRGNYHPDVLSVQQMSIRIEVIE
jgi:hypothetical protein